MGFSLADKVAIVVGSSSGMGRATAITFAETGAKVVLAARSADKLAALAEEIGENAIACPTDVQDSAAVDRLIATTLEHFGRIDVLVYVTGTNIPERSLEVLSNETWDMMIQTNLTGAFYCTKAQSCNDASSKGRLNYLVSSGAVRARPIHLAFPIKQPAWMVASRSRYVPRRKRERYPHLNALCPV